MAERKALPKSIRFEVFKRDKFTCQYCGRMAPDVILEVDHLKPIAKGGDNSILNLVTSCRDCNRGKKDRELADDTIIKKQQAQLEELAERREQLEMVLEYRNELKRIETESAEAVVESIKEATGFDVTDDGKKRIKEWIKNYSLLEVLDATEIALNRYFDKSKISLEFAFNKIPGVCHNARMQKNSKIPYYINYTLKSLRGKNFYFNETTVKKFIKNHVNNDDAFDDIKTALKTARTFSDFQYMCEQVFGMSFEE